MVQGKAFGRHRGLSVSEYLKVTSGNIDSAKPSATPTPTPAPSNGTVQAKTTSDLNVRKGPGTSYGIIKVIDMNVTVTVTEATNSSWYKVKLPTAQRATLPRST